MILQYGNQKDGAPFPARRLSFHFSLFMLRQIILLSLLDQLPGLHQMPQHQRTLLGTDVQQLHDVLPVGKARPLQICPDGLQVLLRRNHRAGQIVLRPDPDQLLPLRQPVQAAIRRRL